MYRFLDVVPPTDPPNMGGTPTEDGQTDRVLPPSSPTKGILARSFCSGYQFPIDSVNAASRRSASKNLPLNSDVGRAAKLPLNCNDGAA